MERPLERVRVSSWKSHGRTGIVVLVDASDVDRGDNALPFHFVHVDDEETHQDALTCLIGTGLVVATACGKGDRTRVQTP